MVLINYQSSSQWIFILASLNSVVISNAQSQDQNPFIAPAQGGAAAAAPMPSASSSSFNPFAPTTATKATSTTSFNPFTSTTATTTSSTSSFNPFTTTNSTTSQNPFTTTTSSDSSSATNAAGTCCCDPKKTFQAAATPQLPGGCCAAGNKWGSGCQDGGSFLYNPLACPVLHRNTRITPSGPKFELFCNVQTQRANLKIDHADSFLECVDACGATAGCVGVDYDKVLQQCFYKSEYMDENTAGAPNNNVDSASMPPPPPLTCPGINGQVTKVGGIDFKFSCDKPVSTTTVYAQSGANTVDACAQACASQPKCNGMNFRFADKGCYLHTLYQNPPAGTEAGFLTMIPVVPR